MFSAQVVEEIRSVAEANGVEPAALLAIAQVESAGTAFWTVGGKKVPPVRPEGHYFYKLTTSTARQKAVRAGLASPKAGAVKVPSTRTAVYAMIERMKAIDPKAALMSCSWGIGQVMGSHWRALGYGSVQELVDACSTVTGQVDLMWRFIKKNKLDDEIARHDWAGFARGYNGPAYKKNAYDKKMATQYKRYKKAGPVVAPNEKVRSQLVDSDIKDAQNKLRKVGYNPGRVDGKLGPKTREALRKFQLDNGLEADGDYGTMTRDALDEALRAKNGATGDKYIAAGLGTGGADIAVDKLSESTSILSYMGGSGGVIDMLLVALTVTTVGLVLWGLYKKLKR